MLQEEQEQQKNFWTQNFFRPNFFLCPIFFRTQILFQAQIFSDPKIFSDQKLFLHSFLFRPKTMFGGRKQSFWSLSFLNWQRFYLNKSLTLKTKSCFKCFLPAHNKISVIKYFNTFDWNSWNNLSWKVAQSVCCLLNYLFIKLVAKSGDCGNV